MPLHGLPKTLGQLATKVKRAGTKSLEEVAANIVRRMSEEGKQRSPGEKVDWDSPKQKRAYFATNGFGGGIPTKRTHRYRKGWRKKSISTGMKVGVEIYNRRKGAGAIGGMPRSGWQSRIHRKHWNYLPKIVMQEARKLPMIVMKNVRIEFR